MLEKVFSYAIIFAVLLGLIGFLYATIFRAGEWSGSPGTNPKAVVRGTGIAVIGGVMLGIYYIAEDNGAGEWIKVLQVMGGVTLVGGIILMFGVCLMTVNDIISKKRIILNTTWCHITRVRMKVQQGLRPAQNPAGQSHARWLKKSVGVWRYHEQG